MARIGRFGFVVIAVLFHLVYIYSIFDVYFVSPIVHGMQAFAVERGPGGKPPAQRLVLIVGDGLRADKAFQSFPDPSPEVPGSPEALRPRPLAPFLRSRVEHHGTFGVSHTRVPTESRPGHVALIAGLYEDVSAVTTGWKLNPVNFDSVFNRSRHTWSWGSPDILLMFKEGAVPGRVYADTYGEEFEDFTSDATRLDTWVFDRVEEMFKSAATNSTLDRALRQDKNVFFLHLLGLDTTGHGYRPYSAEYLHNIKVVDKGVERMARIIEDFYRDDRTAFVFTADHGMSDWGAHGDGHPDNTRTPLIVWGSGVRRPVIQEAGKAPGHEDGFSFDWGLDHVARHDVAQADVAALMAYLAGLEFPVNSVGELPLAYVAAGRAERAEAALVNARGVLEMYRVKEEQKRATELNYRPYVALGDRTHSMESRTADIEASIADGEFDKAIQQSHELLQLGIDGLRYLQTYDWLFLRVLVTLGYLGWIAFAVTTVIDLHVLHGRTEASRNLSTTAAFGAALVALFSFLVIKRSPATYYLYAFFPIVFWEEVCARREALVAGRKALMGHVKSPGQAVLLGLSVVASVGFLEALVLSYFYRELYSVLYIAAVAWPLLYGPDFIKANKILVINWGIACVSMSVFTCLPAMKVESSNIVLLGGFLMSCVGVLYLVFETHILSPQAAGSSKPFQSTAVSRALLGIQVGLILLAMVVTRSSIAHLQAKRGLPLGNQVVGWTVLVASLGVPFLHSLQPNRHYLHRLVVLFLTFSPTFVILTISYEGLFYVAFCMTLVTWVRLEHHIYTFSTRNEPSSPSPSLEPRPTDEAISADEGAVRHRYRALRFSDARTALFFFYLIQSAFFSVGNIAAVSAFSLDSVSRLIPIFDPFSQSALLMFKLMVPFAVMSANLGILNRRLGVAPSSLFMVVIAMSDVLTMNFFWLVRDEGSWLDIGMTISHFVIASLLCAFVALLELASEVFVSGVEVGGDDMPAGEKGQRSSWVAAGGTGTVDGSSRPAPDVVDSSANDGVSTSSVKAA